jgi:hypothetical protein
MVSRPRVAATLLLAALASPAARAHAAARPRFEPTDLEWEETGIAELDLQFGPVRGQGPWRIVVPDFELDLGLLPWLEIDLDGAYAVEGPDNGPFSLDHSAPDALWPSVKLSNDLPFSGGAQRRPSATACYPAISFLRPPSTIVEHPPWRSGWIVHSVKQPDREGTPHHLERRHANEPGRGCAEILDREVVLTVPLHVHAVCAWTPQGIIQEGNAAPRVERAPCRNQMYFVSE